MNIPYFISKYHSFFSIYFSRSVSWSFIVCKWGSASHRTWRKTFSPLGEADIHRLVKSVPISRSVFPSDVISWKQRSVKQASLLWLKFTSPNQIKPPMNTESVWAERRPKSSFCFVFPLLTYPVWPAVWNQLYNSIHPPTAALCLSNTHIYILWNWLNHHTAVRFLTVIWMMFELIWRCVCALQRSPAACRVRAPRPWAPRSNPKMKETRIYRTANLWTTRRTTWTRIWKL